MVGLNSLCHVGVLGCARETKPELTSSVQKSVYSSAQSFEKRVSPIDILSIVLFLSVSSQGVHLRTTLSKWSTWDVWSPPALTSSSSVLSSSILLPSNNGNYLLLGHLVSIAIITIWSRPYWTRSLFLFARCPVSLCLLTHQARRVSFCVFFYEEKWQKWSS